MRSVSHVTMRQSRLRCSGLAVAVFTMAVVFFSPPSKISRCSFFPLKIVREPTRRSSSVYDSYPVERHLSRPINNITTSFFFFTPRRNRFVFRVFLLLLLSFSLVYYANTIVDLRKTTEKGCFLLLFFSTYRNVSFLFVGRILEFNFVRISKHISGVLTKCIARPRNVR